MGFMDEISKTLGEEFNYSVTENGALGYRESENPLVDVNFKVSSFRNMSQSKIIDFTMKAYYADPVLFFKWLFYLRDVREGLGERRTFRIIFKDLAKREPERVTKLLPLIYEYGRWDDLFVLRGTPVENTVIQLIKERLQADVVLYSNGKPFSLLAKWMPSENTSSKETRDCARWLMKELGFRSKNYRKMLSTLRKALDVVERKTSSNNWNEINYEAVPSKANILYRNSFLKHDESRRRDFLGKLAFGEAKINSSVNFPHDIVHSYNVYDKVWGYSNRVVRTDDSLEALWKALPNTVGDNDSVLVVADGSGSMYTCVGGTNVLAIEIANALAIYFAERCNGEFKNKYITFSSRPQLVNLDGGTLLDNLRIAEEYNEVANTNISAVFDLILTTAIRSNMKQSDMPSTVVIISDMEFDQGANLNIRLFEDIKNKFKLHGYSVPKCVFWNVCSRTNTIPMKQNDEGVILLSGFSVNVIKMVLSNKLDPFEALLETLNSNRYKPIEDALK